MNPKKTQVIRYSVVLICSTLILSALVFAHGNEQHVMGTVTKIEKGSISVKTTTGEVKVVMILATTKFVKGTSAATQQDVKVGDRVVIHAKSEGNMLHATEVRMAAAKEPVHHH